MSYSFKVSARDRYTPAFNIFSATWNNPVVGKFSFNDPLNTNNQRIIQLRPKVIYLIEFISVGGNIAESIYNNSFAATDRPQIRLIKEVGNNILENANAIPLVNFFDYGKVNIVIWSEKSGDWLRGDVTGTLNQTADTVGLASIDLTVSFAIRELDNATVRKYVKESLPAWTGKSFRG